jgi:hypothetical protein
MNDVVSSFGRAPRHQRRKDGLVMRLKTRTCCCCMPQELMEQENYVLRIRGLLPNTPNGLFDEVRVAETFRYDMRCVLVHTLSTQELTLNSS